MLLVLLNESLSGGASAAPHAQAAALYAWAMN